MFFCKHVFTNFFYLKKQNTFISTFSFDAIDFFEDYISAFKSMDECDTKQKG